MNANIDKWREVFAGIILEQSQVECQHPIGEGKLLNVLSQSHNVSHLVHIDLQRTVLIIIKYFTLKQYILNYQPLL